ncbi:UNVERIFIED_CONTAM: hypothetical protein PYX00_010055 [Menopon gallinae]|uniref:Uncharacterized protein n=1 Tax=Menopon gallinae TaxID=328185 RepID=A0AAW2HDZ1_9NEOP
MRFEISLLLLVAWSARSEPVEKRSLSDDLSRFISNTKVELIQTVFKPRHVKKDVTKVKLSQEKGLDVNVSKAGDLGGLFRRAEHNFVFNGAQVLRLRKEDSYDMTLNKYSLDTVNEFALEEGAVFFKQIDWANIFFLVVCYARAYCRARMSHSITGVTSQQRITTIGTPEDIEFFVDRDELYLIIATDPCKIFRWTGTYFDEDDELDTSGARAVTAFQDRDAVVIVVAQNVPSRKVYSKVFVRRNRKTELIQLLHTTEALNVISYSLDSEEESLKFVFIQNNRESSSIFWWNGREFYLWKSLEDIVGPGHVYVDSVNSELFFFFAYQNNLRVYHPTELTFDLVNVLILDREILSFDLREEANQPTKLLLLTRSDLDPFLTVNVISIDVNYIPVSDGQLGVTDPVLQCLLDLKQILTERGVKLEESIALSNEIKKQSGSVETENLTVEEVELKNFTVQNLKVNPPGVKLEATPTEIKRELDRLKMESSAILEKLESATKQIRYRVHGDVVIDQLRASHIHVKKFNGRAFDLRNIVSVTKNQTLSGSIRISHLIADTLTVPSINGVPIKDLLLRNKPVQTITGEHTVKSMKANSVVVGAMGSVNGKKFSNAEKTRKIIRGKKTFTHMNIKHIDVDYVNNVPAEEWLSRIIPTSQPFSQREPLTFKELSIGNLTVANINGVPWKDYFDKLSDPATNGTNVPNNTKVTHLKAKKINGIPVSSFVTKGTPQNVSSTIDVTTIRAVHVKPLHFNGGSQKMSQNPHKLPSLRASKITFKNPVNISGRIVDFSRLNETYWFKSEPQTIETFLTFTKELTVGDMEALYINKNSVDGFIHLREPNNATSKIIFEDAEVIGNVVLSASTERHPDLRKWYNSAVKTTGTNHITGNKVFTGDVTTKKLSVQFLNELDVSSDSPILAAPALEGIERVEILGDVHVKSGITLKLPERVQFQRRHIKSNKT